jgi:L-threonylcarbamoyladenylate synthase
VTAPDVAAAVAVLRAGGLVAFPTETVYGLGADASNPEAVRAVYRVKGRPADHPLIVHVASAGAVPRWAVEVPPAAAALAEACWPGPLTLLLVRRPDVDATVAGARDTIGLRVPAHPLALALLEAFDGGIAAPSANHFGRVSPTTAAHVRADLGNEVDLILDGGPCTIGVESTIVDVTVDPPVLLRPGGVPLEALEAIVSAPLRTEDGGASRAPGMLASHYAPLARVEVIEDGSEARGRVEELRAHGDRAELLDPGPDPDHYARHLYEWLRDADEAGVTTLVAVPPPALGLGWAVRDRLRKAAAPRR